VWLDANSWQKQAYLIVNLICDSFNYIVFLLVNLGIDIHMLVRLKRVLDEKSQRFHNGIQNNMQESKKKGNKNETKNEKKKDDPMNQAIKMVVLNTSLGIVLKLPSSFIPIYNVISVFYYKFFGYTQAIPGLETFIYHMSNSDLLDVILDFTDLLHIILISIQLFIYIHFDKKIKHGFDRIFSANSKQTSQNS